MIVESDPLYYVAYAMSTVGLLLLVILTTRLHLRNPRDNLVTVAWIVLALGAASVVIRTQLLFMIF